MGKVKDKDIENKKKEFDEVKISEDSKSYKPNVILENMDVEIRKHVKRTKNGILAISSTDIDTIRFESEYPNLLTIYFNDFEHIEIKGEKKIKAFVESINKMYKFLSQ